MPLCPSAIPAFSSHTPTKECERKIKMLTVFFFDAFEIVLGFNIFGLPRKKLIL